MNLRPPRRRSVPRRSVPRRSPERTWLVEAPGLLGWLGSGLVWLALGVAVSAAALSLPGSEPRLPEGFARAAWFVLLAAGLVWVVRLGSQLLVRQVLGSLVALCGVLGHAFLLLGLAAGRGLGGLLGVFSLFLATGEILGLIELRVPSPPGWLRRGRSLLPPRLRAGLTAGLLAAYFLLVLASFR